MNAILRIFNYRFYVKELLLILFGYLFIDETFSWLLIPNSNIVQSYQKIFGFVVTGILFYYYGSLKKAEKTYLWVFAILITKLVLESLSKFNSVFEDLTMYYILFPVLFAIFIKFICRTFELDLLEFLAKFYLLTYVVFMLWHGRGFSFSLSEIEMNDYGPFSGDGRILHASKVYMMLIPFLWYFNKFITQQKIKYLLPVLFCFTVLLIHQHRSVWSCSILASFIYLALLVRSNYKTLPKIYSFSVGALLLLLVAYFFVSNLFPGFVDFLGDRFAEIFDPNNVDSTGRFRADQREVYGEMFWQRPLFGWTFEGFEMPNPLVDWWPEKTGQHFHEGYMEMLFYQGIIGFLFKFSLFGFVLYKAFSKKLTNQTMIMIAFVLSGLLFSLNYVFPLIFWGHLGLCLYYIEKDEMDAGEEMFYEVEEESDNQKQLAIH